MGQTAGTLMFNVIPETDGKMPLHWTITLDLELGKMLLGTGV